MVDKSKSIKEKDQGGGGGCFSGSPKGCLSRRSKSGRKNLQRQPGAAEFSSTPT